MEKLNQFEKIQQNIQQRKGNILKGFQGDLEKAGHKYIKRTGTPGHYKYEYDNYEGVLKKHKKGMRIKSTKEEFAKENPTASQICQFNEAIVGLKNGSQFTKEELMEKNPSSRDMTNFNISTKNGKFFNYEEVNRTKTSKSEEKSNKEKSKLKYPLTKKEIASEKIQRDIKDMVREFVHFNTSNDRKRELGKKLEALGAFNIDSKKFSSKELSNLANEWSSGAKDWYSQIRLPGDYGGRNGSFYKVK